MYRHVPNLITILRLILTVVFFVILNLNTKEQDNFQRQMWIGFVVFVIAGLTDALDGYLARKWNVESAFGRIVDPFADKILICGAFVFFSSNHFVDEEVRKKFHEVAEALAQQDQVPSLTGVEPWMVVVLLGREFLITSIRGLAEAQGVKFRADWAGKIKMFTQAFAVGAVMVNLATISEHKWIHVTRNIAIWVTVIVTILSATTYIIRAWKIFGSEGPKAGAGNGP